MKSVICTFILSCFVHVLTLLKGIERKKKLYNLWPNQHNVKKIINTGGEVGYYEK